MAKKLRGQLFARLALDYFDHPKIAGLSSDAIVAHLEMLVYARRYLTDGVIPMRVAMRYALPVVDELASNDPDNPSVIRRDDGSLLLHGYEDFQETREDVEGRRRSAQERAEKRWSKSAHSNATSNARSTATRTAHSNAETETETETYIRASQASAREPSRAQLARPGTTTSSDVVVSIDHRSSRVGCTSFRNFAVSGSASPPRKCQMALSSPRLRGPHMVAQQSYA